MTLTLVFLNCFFFSKTSWIYVATASKIFQSSMLLCHKSHFYLLCVFQSEASGVVIDDINLFGLLSSSWWRVRGRDCWVLGAAFRFSTKMMAKPFWRVWLTCLKMDQKGSQGDFAPLIHWDAQGHHNSYLVERAKLTCYARFLSEWLWLRGRPMLTKYPILKHKHFNQHYKETQKLGSRVVLSGKRACKKEDFF